MHRRNGSADCRSATLSAGKRSVSASYPDWQLTVAVNDWISLITFYTLPCTSPFLQSCSTHDQPARCELRWAQISSNILYTYQINLRTSLLHVSVQQHYCVSWHTTTLWWGCPVKLNCFWLSSAVIGEVSRSIKACMLVKETVPSGGWKMAWKYFRFKFQIFQI